MAGLMLVLALAAMDSTIVGTAIPTIVRDLGGFSRFTWIFSVYLLTQAVTIPIYGKLADLYGRKPVLFLGVTVFLLGSVLSGLSHSMLQLIVFRGLQGIGAGAVQPIAVTVIGDIFSLEERARMQGIISSVWGVASVIGPALGGFLVEYASWRWIFFVNLPIGLLGLLILGGAYREEVRHREHRIDAGGASLLMLSMVLLLLGLLEGGITLPWLSPAILGLLLGGAALFGLFLLLEARLPEPVLPLWVFRNRVIGVGNLGGIVAGVLTVGVSSFLPTFVEGVQAAGPTVAGAVLAAMSVGWPSASALAGRIYLRFGFRRTALLGALIGVLAGGGLFRLGLRSTPPVAAFWSFLMGVGLGFYTTAIIVAIQSAVGWRERGVATGSNMFTRMLGGTLGVAVLGSVLNSRMLAGLGSLPPDLRRLLPGLNAAALVLGGGRLPRAAGRAAAVLRRILFSGMHAVFGVLLLATLLGLVVFFLPEPSPADE